MIVLSMSLCPPALHGDISKWMIEIDTGVFVGNLSARVRDELWNRICTHIGSGRAILIYNAKNAQGYSIRTHNTVWKTSDFDGLTFMFHPVSHDETVKKEKKPRKRKEPDPSVQKKKADIAKTPVRKETSILEVDDYTVIDLETTGLNPESDSIIEIAAVHVQNGKIVDEISYIIKNDIVIPAAITELTGITNDQVATGEDAKVVLAELLKFIGERSLVSHNASFDFAFINNLCSELGCSFPQNKVYDTLKLSRKLVRNIDNYRLATLAAHFGIDITNAHRALPDSLITLQLFEELKKIVGIKG